MSSSPIEPVSPAAPSAIIPKWVLLLVGLLCFLAIFNVYYGRVIKGPADLYRKDQSKTIAYTVDMVLNHRFSLPRDPIFQPATKPPLYNWFAAAGVAITGQYGEWAQKSPSILSALVVAGLIFIFCRRHYSTTLHARDALLLAMFAAAIWICSKSTLLLLYIARPDMLQALCLTGAWMAANAALGAETKRAARKWAAWFWIGTTAAALAKGPAAVYPILYALLAAPLVFGNWRRLRNLHWLLGLLFLFGSVGVWLLFAYRQDAQHVTGVLLGTEVYQRIASSNPEGFIKPWYFAVQWWYSQNTYWSYLAIGSMVIGLLGSIRRFVLKNDPNAPGDVVANRFFDALRLRDGDGLFTGPAGMATLWAMVVVGCLSIPADKRQDFLLPAHPASAILAANFLLYLVSRFEWTRFALPLGAALLLSWEKRFINSVHLSMIGGAFLVLLAAILFVRKTRPRMLLAIAGAALIVFVAFEIVTNTRFGFTSTSQTITFIGFFGGASVVAALFTAALPKFRLELPFIAGGIIFWGFALLQNNYKDTGLPGKTNPSRYAAEFAAKAKQIVGDEKVVAIFRSKNPILTMMGRHQGSYLTRKDFEEAKWVIVERSKFPELMDNKAFEVLVSGRVDVEYGHVHDMDHKIMKDRVVLLKIDKEKNIPDIEKLISIFVWVQDWTTDDANPYRSPNTGWIELPGTTTPPKWRPTSQSDPWWDYVTSSHAFDGVPDPDADAPETGEADQ